MKIYLIYSPSGELYRPYKRGNCTYVRKHAAEARAKTVFKSGYSVKEYELIDPAALSLLEDSALKLACLEAGGVDNWEGYDFAMEEYHATVE